MKQHFEDSERKILAKIFSSDSRLVVNLPFFPLFLNFDSSQLDIQKWTSAKMQSSLGEAPYLVVNQQEIEIW